MKISNVEVLQCDAGWRIWSFIKIETDEGLVGWSECTDSHGSPEGIKGIVTDLSGKLVGKDPRDINMRLWEMHAATKQSPGSIIQKTIGAIENALWDIKGKAFGVPVYELLGGAVRNSIPTYWSHWGTSRVRAADKVGETAITDLEGVRALVRETKERGFGAVKTNIPVFGGDNPPIYMPGFNKGIQNHPSLEVDQSVIDVLVEYVRTIREEGGRGFGIIIDLNYNFKPAGYMKVARALEPFDLTWLEIDCSDPVALKMIKDSTTIPICSGENLYTVRQFRPFMSKYAMDVASIDVVWNGMSESKRIAELANLHEMNVTPHNYYSHMATFISAHLSAVVPNFKILEVDIDDVAWKDTLTTAVPKISGGAMELPTGPGWGADIDESVLMSHPISGR